MSRDSKALTLSRYNQVEDCDPIDEVTRLAARRVIASNATGETLEAQIADATELMRALGVHPDQADEDCYQTRVTPLPNTGGGSIVCRRP